MKHKRKASKLKPRNPNDATMRNIRALRMQVYRLKIRVEHLEGLYRGVQSDTCFALNTFTALAKKIEEETKKWER